MGSLGLLKFHDICEKSWGDPRMPARITEGDNSSNPMATPCARRFSLFIFSKFCFVTFSYAKRHVI